MGNEEASEMQFGDIFESSEDSAAWVRIPSPPVSSRRPRASDFDCQSLFLYLSLSPPLGQELSE